MKTCLLLKSGRTACRSEKFELFLVHNFHFPWLNCSPIHYFLWFLLFEIQPAGFIQGSQPSLGSHFHLITKLQNFTTTANVEGEISNSTNIIFLTKLQNFTTTANAEGNLTLYKRKTFVTLRGNLTNKRQQIFKENTLENVPTLIYLTLLSNWLCTSCLVTFVYECFS